MSNDDIANLKMDLDSPSVAGNIGSPANSNPTGPSSIAQQQQQQQQQHQHQGINTLNATMTSAASNPRSNYDIDVLRLIGQHLTGMGLTRTVGLLLEESGLRGFDHPMAIEFQRQIMAGEFDRASSLVEELVNLVISTLQQQPPHPQQPLISTLQQNSTNSAGASASSSMIAEATANSSSLSTASTTGYPTSNGHAHQAPTQAAAAAASTATTTPTTPTTSSSTILTNGSAQDTGPNSLESIRARSVQEMRLAIAEQKFLELIDDYQHLKALTCLRHELTPLAKNVRYIQHLSTLIMCKSNEQFRQKASWPGKGLQSRRTLFEKLSQYVPPPILLPPRRLSTLLEQAQQLQREHCILHMFPDEEHPNSLSQSRPPLGEPDMESMDALARASTMNGCDANGAGSVKIMGDGDSTEHTNGNSATPLAFLASTPPSLDSANNRAATSSTTNGTSNETHPSQRTPRSCSATGGLGSAAIYYDLKRDHVCSVDRFPLTSHQVLGRHAEDVWYCKWSNDGSKLATAGVGGKIMIWQLDARERKLVEYCCLEYRETQTKPKSVSCLSWSPDDAYLLSCGSEDRPDLWLWNISKRELKSTLGAIDANEHHESYTTCSWHLSGKKFAASSLKGYLTVYDIDGNRLTSRDGVRVQCLAFLHKDPNYILAADSLNRIKMYHLDRMAIEADENPDRSSSEYDVLEETYPILSFTIDQDDKYLAVNLLKQGIHLWDLRLKTLLRVFHGVYQRDNAIYSSFASPNYPFLASGSEDGNVYIYHIQKEQPVAILQGHSRGVNCVSWNPRYPELLVSVSDDCTIRLWAPLDRSEMVTTTALLLGSAQVGQDTDFKSALRCVGEIDYKNRS